MRVVADTVYFLLFVLTAWVSSALLNVGDWLGFCVLAAPFVLWTVRRDGFRLSE